MLDQGLLDAESYRNVWLARLEFVLGEVNTEQRAELRGFLTQIAGTTDKIRLSQQFDANLSPIFWNPLAESKTKILGIIFSGIPGSRVYSLILVILQSGGSEPKLTQVFKILKRLNNH